MYVSLRTVTWVIDGRLKDRCIAYCSDIQAALRALSGPLVTSKTVRENFSPNFTFEPVNRPYYGFDNPEVISSVNFSTIHYFDCRREKLGRDEYCSGRQLSLFSLKSLLWARVEPPFLFSTPLSTGPLSSKPCLSSLLLFTAETCYSHYHPSLALYQGKRIHGNLKSSIAKFFRIGVCSPSHLCNEFYFHGFLG